VVVDLKRCYRNSMNEHALDCLCSCNFSVLVFVCAVVISQFWFNFVKISIIRLHAFPLLSSIHLAYTAVPLSDTVKTL